jgi:hypothetical protein
VTAPDLAVLATAVRFEVVMRGERAEPVFDHTAGDTVKNACAEGVGELYVRRRLGYALQLIGMPHKPSGWLNDVRIALGEYDTYLAVQREAAS